MYFSNIGRRSGIKTVLPRMLSSSFCRSSFPIVVCSHQLLDYGLSGDYGLGIAILYYLSSRRGRECCVQCLSPLSAALLDAFGEPKPFTGDIIHLAVLASQPGYMASRSVSVEQQASYPYCLPTGNCSVGALALI